MANKQGYVGVILRQESIMRQVAGEGDVEFLELIEGVAGADQAGGGLGEVEDGGAPGGGKGTGIDEQGDVGEFLLDGLGVVEGHFAAAVHRGGDQGGG